MRKFCARWWVGDDLRQWRMMSESGNFDAPFFLYPNFAPLMVHRQSDGSTMFGAKGALFF